jgi:hypothetical protein
MSSWNAIVAARIEYLGWLVREKTIADQEQNNDAKVAKPGQPIMLTKSL